MNIKTDSFGIPIFSNNDLIELMYQGQLDDIFKVLCENTTDLEKFNKNQQLCEMSTLNTYSRLDIDQTTFDRILQSEWLMPDKYKNINVLDTILTKHYNLTTLQLTRLNEEYNEFVKLNQINILRYMIFLVDFMKEHNIIWGVGRGSSVSLYILYLIGIHRIDSLKYNLDWKEFFK